MCLFLERNVWVFSPQKQLVVQNGRFAALINTLCPAHESASLHFWCSESSWFGRRQLWLVIPLSHNQLEQILGNNPQNLLLGTAGGWTTRKKKISNSTWCSCAGVTEAHNTQNKPLPKASGDYEELVEFTESTDSSASHAAMPGPCQEKHFAKDPALPPLCSSQIRINAL